MRDQRKSTWSGCCVVVRSWDIGCQDFHVREKGAGPHHRPAAVVETKVSQLIFRSRQVAPRWRKLRTPKHSETGVKRVERHRETRHEKRET